MTQTNGREATALYRFWDITDVLLYVGITRDPPARFGQHGKDKSWWRDVARIDLEWHPSRNAAEVAEKAAIEDEKPLYNIVHSLTPNRFLGRIEWKCIHCGRVVDDGTGYLWIDYADINAAEAAEHAWSQKRDAMRADGAADGRAFLGLKASDLPMLPTAQWRVHHERCDPDPDCASVYGIDIDRIRTLADLVSWTAHLSEKSWYQLTSWPQVLRKAIREDDGFVRRVG